MENLKIHQSSGIFKFEFKSLNLEMKKCDSIVLECEEVVVINECLTCSLIQMGSSLAYGDNSCPQCGANTTVRFT